MTKLKYLRKVNRDLRNTGGMKTGFWNRRLSLFWIWIMCTRMTEKKMEVVL